MSLTLGFDIYGTLIDPHGVVEELTRHLGGRANDFSQVWRQKQLEYTFRRGLMRRYENFVVCTRNALDYTDLLLQTGLDETTKQPVALIVEQLQALLHIFIGWQYTIGLHEGLFGGFIKPGLQQEVSIIQRITGTYNEIFITLH